MLTCLLLAATALAARTTVVAPEARDCDADVPANQYNDRIACRAENVNAAAFAYVDSVLEHDRIRQALGGDPIFTDAQRANLLAGRERAQTAKERTQQAQAFRGSVRKQKAEDADCYVKEVMGDSGPHAGDDDGICTQGEDCEEVAGDGVGDDDGICKLRGNNREVCVQVCQQPLPSDEDEYDPAIATEKEQNIDELEVALNDATAEVRKATQRMLALAAARPAKRALTDCEQYVYDQYPDQQAMTRALVAKVISKTVTDGCGVVCDQDAFGWNCKGACLIFVVVDGIVGAIFDSLDVEDGANGGEQLDRVARCTTEMSADIASISTSVGGTQASLDEVNVRLDAIEAGLAALSESMNARFDTVDGLLCTPQGQRVCFQQQAASPTGSEKATPSGAKGRSLGR